MRMSELGTANAQAEAKLKEAGQKKELTQEERENLQVAFQELIDTVWTFMTDEVRGRGERGSYRP